MSDTNAVPSPVGMGLGNLAKALSIAQAKIKNPAKSRTVTIRPRDGTAYSFSYADLADILDAVRPALSEQGIAIVATLAPDGKGAGGMLLTSRLIHSSGESIESSYPVPYGDAKAMGGAITYGRRYTLSALVGIMAEEDQDADDHQHPSEHAPRKPAPKASSSLSSAAGLPPAGFSQPAKVKEAPKPPAPEPVAPQQEEPAVIIPAQHPKEAESAQFLKVSKRSGNKNGKDWTMYGINVRLAGTDIWANTFDNNIGAVAELLPQGSPCMIVIAEGKPYNGKPSYNCSYLAEAL